MYDGLRWWVVRLAGPICILLGIPVVGGSSPEERTGGLLLLTVGMATLFVHLPVLSRGGRAAVQRRVVRLGRQNRPGLVFRRSRSKRLLFSVAIVSTVGLGLVLVFLAEYFPPGRRFGSGPEAARAIGAVVAVAAAFGLLWRFDRRDTRGLVLLADGLILPTGRGRYFVPWENVADVEVEDGEYDRGLVVALVDPARQWPLGGADAAPTGVHVVGLDTLVAPPRLVARLVRYFWRRPEEREVLGREDVARTLARVEG